MREIMKIEIVKGKPCFRIEDRLYLKDQRKIMEVQELLEESDLIPEYKELFDIDSLFCMYEISKALYESVKKVGMSEVLMYNGHIIRKVSKNLYYVEISK